MMKNAYYIFGYFVAMIVTISIRIIASMAYDILLLYE